MRKRKKSCKKSNGQIHDAVKKIRKVFAGGEEVVCKRGEALMQ
ncbi:hypothetical protein Pint_02608 [Pistacia integerrima]|uniref:Uncharacterized protein n=1 Tax=Pistacia integerrima TaxID=434235 RepID=A0ACC0ZJL0_9ROSI|nr:hypothetical protein Pint_02608 [Pistacia integerrima]